MNLLTGNARSAETQGTGWFIGFSPWTLLSGSDLLHIPQDQPLQGLCIKWYEHPTGHESGDSKPVSGGRTVSILLNADARFQIEFCRAADFRNEEVESVVLANPGDFVAWGPGLFHRWRCVSRSTVLTVRWNPLPAAHTVV
jgi:hypothetical protein